MAHINQAINKDISLNELLLYFSKVTVKSTSDIQKNLESLTYALSVTLDIDRCGLWLFDQSKSILTCKNLFDKKTSTYSAGQQIIISAFPEYFETIKNSRVLNIDFAKDNKLTKKFWHRYLEKIKVNSILNYSIWSNGEIIGVLSLADSRDKILLEDENIYSLIPFTDIAGQWTQISNKQPQLKANYIFDHELLIKELAYLCKKSEQTTMYDIAEKSLKSINSMLKAHKSYGVIFNDKEAVLISPKSEKENFGVEPFQAKNIHNLAKQSRVLWLTDTTSLAIGLPTLMRKIITTNGNSLAIVPSANKTKESRWQYVLFVEFSNKVTKLEKELFNALIQVSTAFSIILEHADTKSILRESLSLAKGAFEGSNIGMAVLDHNYKLIKANKSLKEIVENDLSFIPQLISDRENAKSDELKCQKQKHTLHLKSGTEKYLYTEISSIQGKLDGPPFFLLQALDITKQKEAITSLKEHEQLFRTVIDLSPAFIFAKSLDGTFILANQAVSEVYGTTPDGMVGKKDSDFNNNPIEVKKFREDDARVILGKKEIHIPEEIITDHLKHTRYLQTVKKPILNPRDNSYLVLGVSTDITERKKIEEREIKWLEEIQHSQKLESLSMLAGGIAHDFNNLLQGIVGNCSLAIHNLEPTNKALPFLHKVMLGSDKAEAICNQLLFYSGKKCISKTVFDLTQLVRECSLILENVVSKDVTIIYDIPVHSAFIHGDKTQIEQVILNLVTNAIQAASIKGNNVIIRAGLDLNHKDEKSILLEIEDNGTGIPIEIQPKIFEPFFTTKAKGKGLGLSTVKGIVDNHHGSIEFSSNAGIGTKFGIRLPLIEQPLDFSEVKQANRESKNLTLYGKSILLIDDESLSRDVIKDMLELSGADCIACRETSSISSYFTNNSLKFDLVILDLNTTSVYSNQIYDNIIKLKPDLPILFISGYSEQKLIDRLLKNKNTSYLAKPFNYEKFEIALNSVFD
jgi:PAS domain S-box-containing protein